MLSPKIANANPHTTEPDVRVRIRGSIVQIERENARIRVIVPITATKRSAAGRRRIDLIPFIFFLLILSMLQMIEPFVPLKKGLLHSLLLVLFF